MKYDYIVVGTGFAGATIAEHLSRCYDVLVIDERPHIGGQMYDEYNEDGILIHKYGPHIFHTNDQEVYNYVSRFTDWIDYQHKVFGYIDGQYINIPFNFNSINKLFPDSEHKTRLINNLLNSYDFGDNVNISDLVNIELKDLIYEKIFKNYSMKQWGEYFDVIKSVFERVPIRLSNDNRYFLDKYQGIPKHGYTKLIEKMLSKSNVMLNTKFSDI